MKFGKAALAGASVLLVVCLTALLVFNNEEDELHENMIPLLDNSIFERDTEAVQPQPVTESALPTNRLRIVFAGSKDSGKNGIVALLREGSRFKDSASRGFLKALEPFNTKCSIGSVCYGSFTTTKNNYMTLAASGDNDVAAFQEMISAISQAQVMLLSVSAATGDTEPDLRLNKAYIRAANAVGVQRIVIAINIGVCGERTLDIKSSVITKYRNLKTQLEKLIEEDMGFDASSKIQPTIKSIFLPVCGLPTTPDVNGGAQPATFEPNMNNVLQVATGISWWNGVTIQDKEGKEHKLYTIAQILDSVFIEEMQTEKTNACPQSHVAISVLQVASGFEFAAVEGSQPLIVHLMGILMSNSLKVLGVSNAPIDHKLTYMPKKKSSNIQSSNIRFGFPTGMLVDPGCEVTVKSVIAMGHDGEVVSESSIDGPGSLGLFQLHITPGCIVSTSDVQLSAELPSAFITAEPVARTGHKLVFGRGNILVDQATADSSENVQGAPILSMDRMMCHWKYQIGETFIARVTAFDPRISDLDMQREADTIAPTEIGLRNDENRGIFKGLDLSVRIGRMMNKCKILDMAWSELNLNPLRQRTTAPLYIGNSDEAEITITCSYRVAVKPVTDDQSLSPGANKRKTLKSPYSSIMFLSPGTDVRMTGYITAIISP